MQNALAESQDNLRNMNVQVREKKVVAGASVIAAVFLTCTKLVVGLMTGSLGILAEAAHSALDLAAAVITFFAVRISDRPADDTHLYGHGKVENLSALAETLLLLLTCAWIIYEAVRRLITEEIDVDPNIWAFLIMGLSIVIDFSRSRALCRIARKYGSQALEADALHFSTDIWSSTVVIIGLGLVKFGQYRGEDAFYQRADAVAALVVAFIVVIVSFRLGRKAVDVLLDRAPRGLADRISRSVAALPAIEAVTRTRVRNVGNKVFVDLIVEVPRHRSLEEIDQQTQEIQEAVYKISPQADVVVHTVPSKAKEGILERIQSVAAREHVSIHNISTHQTEQGMWIDLDLEVDPELSLELAHESATNLESKLRDDLVKDRDSFTVAGINVHIEPRAEVSAVGAPVARKEAGGYIQRIREIESGIKGSCGCHDITLHEVGGTIYLSLHLLIDPGIPIKEVHGIAEEMESLLRREFPELGRVVIHTEPE
jgi:cation diffusion facilitator family transporter